MLGLAISGTAHADTFGNQVILKRTNCSTITQNGLGCYDTDDHTLCFGNGSSCVAVGGGSVSDADYGDITVSSGVWAVDANSVALTTDTTGNYAAGDAEAGNALAGDSATAFFGAGTIEHERGGLEADVSAYDGLIGITGGATYNQTGTTTQIIIFDGAGAPTSAALSGDVTMTNAGVVSCIAGITRDTEWDTEGEVQTAWGSVNILLETEIDASSELLALMDDETGSGLLVFGTAPTLLNVDVKNGATSSGIINIYEDTDNGVNKTSFQVGIQAGDITYTLPTDDGDVDQVLSTNGSGVLDWVTGGAGSGDITAVGDCTTGACFEGAGAETLLSTAAGSGAAGVDFSITAGAGGTNFDGGSLYLKSGIGNGTGGGGTARLQAEDGGATGGGGWAELLAGNAGEGGTAAGGEITIRSGTGGGAGGDSNAGWITLQLGTATANGNRGTVYISAQDGATAETIFINATQANVTASDKYISFTSSSGEEASIAGTAVAGVIAYNTFTGSHKTITEGSPETLMLVEMTGETIRAAEFAVKRSTREIERQVPDMDAVVKEGEKRPRKTITETVVDGPAPKEFLPKTRVCTTKASKACYGVYGGRDKDGMDNALALGTGWILVANKGMDLEAGDYLESSDVAGHAELQADDVKRSSTVASVSENVTWQPGEESRRVACRYLMG